MANRSFILLAIVAVVTALGVAWPPFYTIGLCLLVLVVALIALDAVMLFARGGVEASRSCAERFSNGDDNEVVLHIRNTGWVPLRLHVIDEAPVELHRRDLSFEMSLDAGGERSVNYSLRPVRRGRMDFGNIVVVAETSLRLAQRTFRCPAAQQVKVYPSFMMLNRMEILSVSNSLVEAGIKRIRRVGNNTEFEQIKDYVQGDDYRTINWKATARRSQLMVNVYQDERSQQIYSLIDKGRLMQQAFNGMTLLDYAINAALVLSYVAINKDDKAGLMTYAAQFDTFVRAGRQHGHMRTILENLYHQQTEFGEPDYAALCKQVNRYVNRRSFIVMFTAFSGMSDLNRCLPYLKQMNSRNRLLIVFFDDVEMRRFIDSPMEDALDYFQHVSAERYQYERRLIVSTLRQNGIFSMFTTPDQLIVNVVNRYLEMKSRNQLT